MRATTKAPVSTPRLLGVQEAIGYARRRHGRQVRLDGSPFIEHPLEVAELLEQRGASDQLVIAALLHDVLEKTSATEDELRGLFGSRVADLVAAVSDDASITDWRERKAASRGRLRRDGDTETLALFAADKISRIRELRRAAEDPPLPSRRERMAHYVACLHLVERRLPSSSLVAMLRSEIDAFDQPLVSGAAISRDSDRM